VGQRQRAAGVKPAQDSDGATPVQRDRRDRLYGSGKLFAEARNMRVRPVLTTLLTSILAAAVLPAAGPPPSPVPNQDMKLLRLVERSLPWYPDSTFKILKDDRYQTPSGSYRFVGVQRTCESKYLNGPSTWLVDEVAGTVWSGSVGQLPVKSATLAPDAQKRFLEQFLPEALRRGLRMRIRVSWDSGGYPSGALIPFTLKVMSGYGEFAKPAAMTADGKFLMIGYALPQDRDPVEYRKKLLAGSDLVIWDHAKKKAGVEIVEFSDFECPGCRAKWPLISKMLERFGGQLQHGMVTYPLTTIHPWAFRAASAAWCVGAQDPALVIPLKEQFYSVQGEMTVSDVAPTVKDFVAGHGMDEAAFASCFLAEPSISAVHRQLALAQQLGVNATPTYFLNGWQVQVPEEAWLAKMIKRLAAGQDP